MSSLRSVLILLIVTALMQIGPVQAAGANREEFIALVEALDSRIQRRFAALELLRLVSEEKAVESLENDGLAPEELDALLRFEERNPSTHLGLMALRKVILVGGRFGLPPSDVFKCRTRALRRLHAYASFPVLSETLSHLADPGFVMSGYADRNIGDCLRAIICESTAKPNVTAAARLKLCDWILSFESFVQYRENILQRLDELKGIDDAASAKSRKEIEFFLPVLPTVSEYRSWKIEANELLAALAVEKTSYRIPKVRPHGHPDIVRVDLKATKKLPTIASLAAKRERHRVGSYLEDLQVKSVDGKNWRLTDQTGKVVVIQFSFTGCAPCKRMYPTLSKLNHQFADSLRVLTIMQDDNLDTTKNSIVENNISWPVVCDNEPGGVTDRWCIESFPTVIVVCREGRIASLNANENEELERLVTVLVCE